MRLAHISDLHGMNALMAAAYIGDHIQFVYLSQYIHFFLEDYRGYCALTYMALGLNFNMLSISLDVISQLNLCHLEHCVGNCVAACISTYQTEEAKKLIGRIEHLDRWVNYVSHGNILHHLAAHGSQTMIDLVMSSLKNTSIANSVDSEGNTPLSLALDRKNFSMVCQLIALVNAMQLHTPLGDTP